MEILFGDCSSGEEADSPSLRGVTRISYMDFSELPSNPKPALPIRISSRNRIVREKLNLVSDPLTESMAITSSCIQKLDPSTNSPQLKLNPSSSHPQLTHKPYFSCFLLYIIGPKHLRYTISETELKHFRYSFKQMLQKSDSCHEAHFGLGKLSAYTSNFADSQKHLKKALAQNPEDLLYKVWFELISDWVRNESESNKASKEILMKLIKNSSDQIEYLWPLMMLLLNDEHEKRFVRKIATRLKKLDSYLGYLAWGEVFKGEKNEDRQLSVLREMLRLDSGRPEAYYKLWRYHYDNKQFRESEEIAAAAFVRVTNLVYSHYFILFCICYAKSFVKTGKIRAALELLQQKYMEHKKHGIFLYFYGKICIKSQEESYMICGITAMEECLRVCDVSIHGKILYWLGNAYNTNDEITKSNSSLQRALKLLSNADKQKVSQINLLLGRQSALMAKLKQIENNKFSLRQDEIAQRISETHPIEGILAFGQSVWAQDKQAGFNFLYNYRSTVSRCDYFFLLFKYAKSLKDFSALKKQSKKLLRKVKNLSISTSDWVNCHIWYAKALAYTGKPEKGIILLKCLGKVFPNIPYLDIKYVKFLTAAETVEDLLDCNITQTYRQSIHIVSNAYLQALATRNVPLFLQEKKFEAQNIYLSDSIIENSPNPSELIPEDRNSLRPSHRLRTDLGKFSNYSKFASQNFEFMLEKRTKAGFFGFSFSSDPEFLLIISKIALRHETGIKDGLLAIEDYLEIIEEPELRIKGTYYKAMLLFLQQNDKEYLPLMQDLLSALKQSSGCKKLATIKRILDLKS